MKNSLLAGAALLAVLAAVGPARAGGIYAYDWSGFTVGLSAGTAMSNYDAQTKLSMPGDPQWLNSRSAANFGSDTGFTGGVSAGFNWQIDRIVAGVEGDLNVGGFDGGQRARYTDAFGVTGDTAEQTFAYRSSGYRTLRARLGYALDNVLLYGTLGVASTTVELSSRMDVKKKAGSASSFDTSQDYKFTGLAAGLGIELGFDRWSIGAEYLTMPAADADQTEPVSGGLAHGSFDSGFRVARTTLKYRF